MKKMHSVVGRVMGIALLCTSAFAATASAQSGRATVATFDGPVRVGNVLLAAGTYRFDLPGRGASQDVVAIYDTRNEFIAIARVLPTQRGDAGPSLVTMSEATAAPRHVTAIYMAGSHMGYEFVSPHPAGTLVAQRTR